jgi:hypothetical protein
MEIAAFDGWKTDSVFSRRTLTDLSFRLGYASLFPWAWAINNLMSIPDLWVNHWFCGAFEPLFWMLPLLDGRIDIGSYPKKNNWALLSSGERTNEHEHDTTRHNTKQPERIEGRPYTIRSDVWSTGISLLEFAQNRFPYPPDLGPIDLLQVIVQGPVPSLDDEERDDENGARVSSSWSALMKDFIRVW